ncbi:sister chromatid cohesion protein DCC1 [Rhizoctonia solani 123E]|uniref:Sister chromatid cohesion protein DCC1 n=1 Tax=Rhizoctonia solani 123E TaxID=1423351 RepID=A0A074S5B1_9AGAM|nr:sister chromatid cohesion protein DCC1 [Rhizoctonia solani 123E]
MEANKTEFQVRFSDPNQDKYQDPLHYCLVELPPDIVELAKQGQANLSIRGRPDDEAVLCTQSKTYAIRSVALSNSVLIMSNAGPDSKPCDSAIELLEPGETNTLVISGEVSEILELIPTVPRLESLLQHLRGCEWNDDESDEETYESNVNDPLRRRRMTLDELRNIVQASDSELEEGLRKARILNLAGTLRPLPTSSLTEILVTLLLTIASTGLPRPPKPIPLLKLMQNIEDEFQVNPDVMEHIASWYGVITGKGDKRMWEADIKAIIGEIGVGILRRSEDAVEEVEFMERWKEQVGDMFTEHIDITLLDGNYLSTPVLHTKYGEPSNTLLYYPRSALPTDAAQRFQALFLTRAKWKVEDIGVYLEDIAVDKKERDRLMLKYTRQLTEPDGVWATARVRY